MGTGKVRIVNKSEERRKADTRIQSSVDRKSNSKKQATAKKAIEQRERQKAAGSSQQQPITNNQIPAGIEVLTGQTPHQQQMKADVYNSSTMGKLYNTVQSANGQGYTATQNHTISPFSMGIYNKAKGISETINRGVQTDKFQSLPGSNVLKYPVKSTASLIQMGGMIPGGVQTMAQNPGVIIPAFTVGGYQATVGTAQALKEDPLQTASDLITGALLIGGGIKAAGVGVKATGAGMRYTAPKLNNVVKPTIEAAIKPAIPTINKGLFSLEMARLQGKNVYGAASSKIPTSQVNAGINRVMFDVQLLNMKGKNVYGAARSKIPTSQVNAGINRVMFDTQLMSMKGKSNVKNMLLDERAQVQLNQLVKPQMEVQPNLSIKSTVKARQISIDTLMTVPGMITNASIQAQKQKLVPDLAMKQLFKQIHTPEQIRISKQRQKQIPIQVKIPVQIKDSVPKQKSQSIFDESILKTPKLPEIFLPEKKRKTGKKGKKGTKTAWESGRMLNDWQDPFKNLKI